MSTCIWFMSMHVSGWCQWKRLSKEFKILMWYIKTTKYNFWKYNRRDTRNNEILQTKIKQSSSHHPKGLIHLWKSYCRSRRKLIQKAVNWRVRALPWKQNQKFQKRRQVKEMATSEMKATCYLSGQESPRNPAGMTIT